MTSTIPSQPGGVGARLLGVVLTGDVHRKADRMSVDRLAISPSTLVSSFADRAARDRPSAHLLDFAHERKMILVIGPQARRNRSIDHACELRSARSVFRIPGLAHGARRRWRGTFCWTSVEEIVAQQRGNRRCSLSGLVNACSINCERSRPCRYRRPALRARCCRRSRFQSRSVGPAATGRAARADGWEGPV